MQAALKGSRGRDQRGDGLKIGVEGLGAGVERFGVPGVLDGQF